MTTADEDDHSRDNIAAEPLSHSYPPAAGATAKHVGSTAWSPTETPPRMIPLGRPSTRASSYATANESDNETSPRSTAAMQLDGDNADQPPLTSISATTTTTSFQGRSQPASGIPGSFNDENDDNNNQLEMEEPPLTATTLGSMTPAAQLRISLARRLATGLSQLRSRSRCMLLFQGAFTIAQIAAFVTMLALSAKQHCDKPLRTFIALHVAKVAVGYPVSFYNALAPPSRPPRGEEDTPESRQRREARRVMGNPRLDARLRTVSDLIGIFSLVWFFLGNVWVYSDTSCRSNSPYLWYTSLTVLIIAYIRVAELVIIVLAVVFFLPLVIIVLRMFGGLEKKHEIGPLTKEEIAKLPTVYYIPAPEAEPKPASIQQEPTAQNGVEKSENGTAESSRTENAAPPSGLAHTQPPPTPATPVSTSNPKEAHARRQRHLLRLLFKRKRSAPDSGEPSSPTQRNPNGIYAPTKFPLHPLPDNLSSCPICLSDYEPPPLLTVPKEERDKALKELEPLTLLPCGHSIHKDCLAPWLQTSGRCPVCQRAVLGEEQENGKKRHRIRRLRRRRRRQPETVQEEEEEIDHEEENDTTHEQTPPLTAASAAPTATIEQTIQGASLSTESVAETFETNSEATRSVMGMPGFLPTFSPAGRLVR